MATKPFKAAVAGWQSTIDDWWERLSQAYAELAVPWVVGQFLIIVCAYGISSLAVASFEPRLEARLRRISGQPRLLRLLAIVLRRLKWIVLALILWLIAAIMGEVTWPSRSYFIRIAAYLVTSWVLISLLSRTIRNRSLARFVAGTAWLAAALLITGFFDPVVTAMDAVGLQVGGFRVSVLALIKSAFILTLLLWFASVVGDLSEQRLQSLDFEPAVGVLLGKALKGGLFVLAFFVSLQVIGLDVTAFAVFSGAFGLGIGFGLQKVASNLISGFIILLDRSIKPGDVISLGNTFGWITSLRARYVSVSTRDGIEYLIPNETFITERLLNMSYSDRAIRLEVRFGVDYESDAHLVKRIAVETVAERERVLPDPQPLCHIVAFGDSSIDFVLRFWIRDPENGVTNLKGDTFLALLDAFKAHGIRIPYPHREVIVRRPVVDPYKLPTEVASLVRTGFPLR